MDKRRLPAAAGLATLVLGLATIPASGAAATATRASTACKLSLGSVNAAGGHQSQSITATNPPTAGAPYVTPDRFSAGQSRLSGSWFIEPDTGGFDAYGKVVLGSTMYAAHYRPGDTEDPATHLTKVGGGWGTFTFFEESRYDEGAYPGSQAHHFEYGLRNDGVLFRWRDEAVNWVATGSYAGFAAVKTMALISQTRTYDTFLANARGGALYTIRIPLSNPLKPIVTKVRGSTWQGFETLIAERCGQHGTLLLGIDKETSSAYLYAVGRASGATTVINGLGKVPTTINNPVHFRWTAVDFASPPLNGD
jgi:hypothetical protein